MYSKRFIVDVFDEHNNSLSGGSTSTISVPFNTEYKIFIKNDNTFPCAVDVKVDGIPALGMGSDGYPTLLILPAKQKYLMEGFFNANHVGGKRFKLVALDSSPAKNAGRVSGDSDNGIIEVTFYPIKTEDSLQDSKRNWMKRLSEHEQLTRRILELRDDLEIARLREQINKLEEEIEQSRRKDRWNPWKDRWNDFPKYEPMFYGILDNEAYNGPTTRRKTTDPLRSSYKFSKSSGIPESGGYFMNKLSAQSFDFEQAAHDYNNPREKTKSIQTSANYMQTVPNSFTPLKEAATVEGSSHDSILNSVNCEVITKPITKIKIKLLGFVPPQRPVFVWMGAPTNSTSTSDDELAQSFCTNCGKKLVKPDFKFCPFCGHALEE